ncbi:contact-dependent growth inhibition system immunity protein (plasmid) [Thioclava litoralis]|uniref:Contact-dependent growth inhibition system immunity protein n=1 Tax=Thioclava litoralis TaxID=3076557 RepID=A0ABZ1E5J6_9RHOB|nr:contact-dependent growth inhibition system immunity protein [Thioclava sp. FTW29]
MPDASRAGHERATDVLACCLSRYGFLIAVKGPLWDRHPFWCIKRRQRGNLRCEGLNMREITQTRRWCQIMQNQDFYFIKTRSGLRSGMFHDPKGREHILEVATDDAELGAALRDSLSASRVVALNPAPDGMTWPTFVEIAPEFKSGNHEANYLNWVAETMARCGYKTKRKMFAEMRLCHVELDMDKAEIDIAPNNHVKLEAWDLGKLTEADNVRISAQVSDAELGAAMRLALRRCT